MDEITKIVQTTKPVLWEIATFAPRVILALAVLFVGWVLARIMKRFVIRILRALRMEEAAERIGIDSFLLQGGVRYTLVTLFAEIVYWFLIFSVMILTLSLLGMTEAGAMFSRILYYVPKVIIAMVILIFGSLLARFIHAVMYAYLDNIGMSAAYIISMVAQYTILAFVIFVTLEQFAIGGQFLEMAFHIAFGALALAFGIAFGFGGIDAAKAILDKALRSRTRERK